MLPYETCHRQALGDITLKSVKEFIERWNESGRSAHRFPAPELEGRERNEVPLQVLGERVNRRGARPGLAKVTAVGELDPAATAQARLVAPRDADHVRLELVLRDRGHREIPAVPARHTSRDRALQNDRLVLEPKQRVDPQNFQLTGMYLKRVKNILLNLDYNWFQLR